jgi:hypothetical protein
MPPAPNVFDDMSAPMSSYMGLLNDVEVNIGAPPLDSFDFVSKEEVDDKEEADDEDVTEIEEDVFEAAQGEPGAWRPTARSSNYSEVEDVLFVKAWSQVGLDVVTDTDQTGKRYWQHIEDKYCKLKPKTSTLVPCSYRSLQGRWELLKPACARWSVAMDQVRLQPPSGSVEGDYVSTILFI